MNISFTPLNESHFLLLLKWLESTHVKKWWDQDVIYTSDLVQEKYSDYAKGYKQINGIKKPIKAYIICLDNQPIGYIQLYNAYDFPKNKDMTELPKSLGAIDLFIGEEAFLGKGIGSKAIKQFLETYTGAYSHMCVDSNLTNAVAIKAYEKAGFQKISEQQDSGEVWMIWERHNSSEKWKDQSADSLSHAHILEELKRIYRKS